MFIYDIKTNVIKSIYIIYILGFVKTTKVRRIKDKYTNLNQA